MNYFSQPHFYDSGNHTRPIKLFDIILHPRLEVTYVHFDLEAIDEDGVEYYQRSKAYGGYAPPHPAFSFSAAKHYITNKYTECSTLDPFDISLIVDRLCPLKYNAGIKSLKFSNQVYVCPKTYVVWQSQEKTEGFNYFEIKKLPKDKNSIHICREQWHDLWVAKQQEKLIA